MGFLPPLVTMSMYHMKGICRYVSMEMLTAATGWTNFS